MRSLVEIGINKCVEQSVIYKSLRLRFYDERACLGGSIYPKARETSTGMRMKTIR